jgi:uncharacterized protein
MASNGLRIADGLLLPIDAVTETFLIFGKRGSGKTTAASVLTEELLAAGLPVCVIDPMGAWWGLRSSADGLGPGLPVMIIGGEHADFPLSPESGETVADLVVSERLPVVLDMFLMSKTKQKKFVTEFMERLFRKNREPLHLVVDEADRFAPQRGTLGEDARLLGAYEDIVLRGRKPGIGSTSITLRPQNLHSAIRSQVEVLIAMRLLGKLEVAAIDEWIRLHATDEEARELKASLPSLPTGTAWVWSPGWLEMMQKIQVRPRLTFDSSATPKVGQQAIVPRQFARVSLADLERMGALLAAVEPGADAKPSARKGAPGPGAETAQLRRQVAALTGELAEAQNRPTERVEVPVLQAGEVAAVEQIVTGLRDVAATLELALSRAAQAAKAPPAPVAPARRAPEPPPRPGVPPASPVTGGGDGKLGKAERAVLAVLAQFPEGRTRQQLAVLSGYSPTSLRNPLGRLRTLGLAGKGDPIMITDAGRDAIGDGYEPLPAGHALVSHWMSVLSKAERTVLGILLDAWPDPVGRPELAERSGYSETSLRNPLGRLRTLELVHDWTADETLAMAARETASA